MKRFRNNPRYKIKKEWSCLSAVSLQRLLTSHDLQNWLTVPPKRRFETFPAALSEQLVGSFGETMAGAISLCIDETIIRLDEKGKERMVVGGRVGGGVVLAIGQRNCMTVLHSCFVVVLHMIIYYYYY